MQEEKLYPRRWSVLAALFIALFCLQFSFIVPGGAAVAVMERYQITPMLYSIVMSIPYLSGIIFGVFSGTLADRIGVSKVIAVGYIIALAGCIWRYFSGEDYTMLVLSSFVMGFATAALNANSAKIIRRWFPGKSNNVAMGVYVAAASLGAAVSLAVGARVSVDMCWLISCILVVIALVLWFVLYREHPDGQLVSEPIKEHLGAVLKNKYVWGISVFAFLFMGLTVVGTSYMVPGLQSINGGDAASAADASTMNTIVVCFSCIIIPAFISRLKKLRGITIALLIVTGVFYCATFFLPFGIWTIVSLFIGGLAIGPVMSITKSLPALLPNVKQEHMGAVGGVQSMFQNIGMFLVAPYLISPIASMVDPGGGAEYYQAAFMLMLVGCVISGLIMFTFPNLRTNVADMLADKRAVQGEEESSV